MLFENIINFIDKYYHFKRINSYLKKLKINNVIDVGFHKGEFYESMSLKKNYRYYAFEANPKIYNYIKKKFYYNKKIKIFNICISDKFENRKFYINNLSSISSLYKDSQFYNFFKKIFLRKNKNFNINLQTESLDRFLIRNPINLKNSLLKIDVEGGEYFVLKGIKKNLHKISYLLLENKFFLKKQNKNIEKINFFLVSNNFILRKKFIYPLLNFEDALYINKSI
jgi:FkbM family methyltransferase